MSRGSFQLTPVELARYFREQAHFKHNVAGDLIRATKGLEADEKVLSTVIDSFVRRLTESAEQDIRLLDAVSDKIPYLARLSVYDLPEEAVPQVMLDW